MAPLYAMLAVAVVMAAGIVWVQFRLADRNYGILCGFLGEVAVGIAGVRFVMTMVGDVTANPQNPGPVGFGAMMLSGHLAVAVFVAILLNAISGVIVWRLTREWR